MIKKYRTPLSVLFILMLMLGMVFGNFQAGKAQSDTDWSVPINLSMSGVATNPAAVVDSKGTIHVIWFDNVDGYRYSRSANGVNWTTPEKVDFPFKEGDSIPFLLSDPTGFIHVFWINGKGELHYAQTAEDNFGDPAYWTFALLSKSAANYDAVIDAQGVIHIAYIENITDEFGTAGVYYRNTLAGAGSWNSARMIYKSDYLRGTSSLDTYIRVSASNQLVGQKVYITWDNRPQKRTFLATSVDSGKTWPGAQQIKGPDDSGQHETPFNASVWASAENLLLMWQVGTPGASKCSVFSQLSKDGGKSWGETIPLFGGPTTCPTGIKYLGAQNGKVIALLTTTGDPILIAWDGTRWSEVQSQVSLPALSNPSTYEPILLGCRQDLIYMNKLFVVGCDQASGGDVWFTSRSLVPVDEWFTTLSIWGNPLVQEVDEQVVSSLSSASDAKGNIHVVWVESSPVKGGIKPSIKYSQWNGVEWFGPETIFWNLNGQPVQLTMHVDSQNRVMLAWVDSSNGDLVFTWANLDEASKASQWETAKILPSLSQINSSPEIVVDASGRIVIAYAVSLNENRGIYLVQSMDNGFTWSAPQQVFNGVLAGWDEVASPQITLGGDGTLHVLFNRLSLGAGRSLGLYYSQSKDGGVTWSVPQSVSENAVSWSDIISYGEQTVHRLWQEDDGLVVANLSQVSLDGGASWGQVLDVTDVSEKVAPVALASNGAGQLSFIQLNVDNFVGSNNDKLTLHDWKWDGTRWNPETTREFIFKDSGKYSVAVGITTENYLGVSLTTESIDLTGAVKSQIISISRFLESQSDQSSGAVSIIPTPLLNSEKPTALPEASPVPTVNSTVLFDSNDPSKGITKNLVGIGLIGIAAIAVILMLTRRRPSAQK